MTEWAAKVLDAPERVMVSWSAKGRAVVSGPISAGVIHTIGATAYIRADLAALTEQNQTWQRNSRETFDAMVAMRNSINEHLPMPSLESDLLQGPENSVFCAAVADAVVQHVAALTAKVAEAGKMLAEQDSEYNRKTNDLIERHAKQTAALLARVARLECAGDFARLIGNDVSKDDKDTVLVSYGMLRRLRAALTDGGKHV